MIDSLIGGGGRARTALSTRPGGEARFAVRPRFPCGQSAQFGARDRRARISLRFGDGPANRDFDHGPLPPAGHCTTPGPCSASAAARRIGVFHAFGVCASS